MKACIIGIMNLKHMTMMSLYTSYFEKNNILYDVIYMDEYGINEDCGADKIYKYNAVNKSQNPVIRRVKSRVNYIKFKNYCCEILQENNYDFIVVWREETAILLSDYLTKEYSQKYSVNIRDIDICIGRRRKYNLDKLKLAVSNSAFNTVSSDGFLKYLPGAEYLFVHSANDYLLSKKPEYLRSDHDTNSRIIISNVGTFRNDEYCFRLADAFAQDDRFELRFIGQGSERMEQYVQFMGYKNIVCLGGFEPQDTLRLLADADVINCAYGNDNIAETTKLPIRFYYAVYLGLPILTTQNTWIEKTANKLKMGLSIPEHFEDVTTISENVYLQYMELDMKLINVKTKDYISDIERSHCELEREIREVLQL